MDTKSKNSRKTAALVAGIVLVIASVGMMITYQTYPGQMNRFTESGSVEVETVYDMGYGLAVGNYILYNEVTEETPPSQVRDEFGKTSFDLMRKFMDCGVFRIEGAEEDNGFGSSGSMESTESSGTDEGADTAEDTGADNGADAGEASGRLTPLGSLDSETAEHLLEEDEEASGYAFRAVFTFAANGDVSNAEVSGVMLTPEEEYYAESNFLNNVDSMDGYGIAEPSGVCIIYGMTPEDLSEYTSTVVWDEYASSVYTLTDYTNYPANVLMLSTAVAVLALLLPCIRRVGKLEGRIFRVSCEIVLFVLCCMPLFSFLAGSVAYATLEGNLWNEYFGGFPTMVINFCVWVAFFGVVYWAFTCLREMFTMKGAYFRERTLTARVLRGIRNGGGHIGSKMKRKAGGIFREIRDFCARQYDALLHLDFRDKTNRTILRIVLINFGILFIVCMFWFYGIFALIVYSVILFLFLKKYTEDLQEKYKLLLKSTNQLAEGHLDVPIEGDIGLFNPIQDELKKIQKGFKKAVEEEVKNERMKTELVTNVSHDLRTPLTAIITYTDLLKNETDETRRKEYINVLEKKSLRLKVLIEDLFEISKAASKSVVMHYMKVDIVDLLKQVGLENDEKIRAANLEFRWKLPEHKLVMWLDSQKTYRIFENLIVNITKYAMPHTRVYIEMTESEENVHISMKNVSATELDFDADEITDRFVRGDSSRNTEGSGLGLAIAKSFVELQHGTLKISTEADLFKADIVMPKLEIPPEEEQAQEAQNL